MRLIKEVFGSSEQDAYLRDFTELGSSLKALFEKKQQVSTLFPLRDVRAVFTFGSPAVAPCSFQSSGIFNLLLLFT